MSSELRARPTRGSSVIDTGQESSAANRCIQVDGEYAIASL